MIKSKNEFERKDKLLTEEFKNDYVKELFRSLRTKVLMGMHTIQDKSLVVTSLDADTGKSTIASNLAITFAQQNIPTLLIDGDLRRGSLHEYFEYENAPGLSDFILSSQDISQDSIDSLVRRTFFPYLYLIPSGTNTEHSSEFLASQKFVALKDQLSKKFGMIILDTAPLGALPDATVVCNFFSRYLVVVKAAKTNVVDLKKKIKEFPLVEKKILGLVLNYAELDKMRLYYKYSKYY